MLDLMLQKLLIYVTKNQSYDYFKCMILKISKTSKTTKLKCIIFPFFLSLACLILLTSEV